jgi:alginate O-acetyltransferase complex protein AlgI
VLFVELRFFAFFFLAFALYWAIPSNRGRKACLLVFGYVFYGAWDWRFVPLLFLSTTVDYVSGLLLSRPTFPASARRIVLCASVAVNLGVLGFFKYFHFFVTRAGMILGAFGLSWHSSVASIILPLGISFYTFESLSYTIDVYRGRPAERSFLDFALFLNFFPHLVAGPIVRAGDFLPQLKSRRSFSDVDLRAALVLFLVGFFKKAVVSDNVAPIVDAYFKDPARFTAASAWLGVLFYAVQIYCDFSGYSDMALALASLFGYRLNPNFAHPYWAANITDFWRRWHMSLSRWLRDYLYIPLGGNRGSEVARDRNVMITMLLGGLWHGAGANFVVWGGLHGLALVAHRRVAPRLPGAGSAALRTAVGRVLTFAWVSLAWVFFRSSSLEQAGVVLRSLVTFRSSGLAAISPVWWVIFAVLAGAHWLAYSHASGGWWRRLPGFAFGGAYGAAWAIVLAAMPAVSRAFIYFQF